MSSVRNHLAEFHKSAMAHHEACAKCHSTIASTMGKSSDSSNAAIAAEHERLAESHTGMANFHQKAGEGTMKGVDDVDLNKLVPTNVQALTPDNPHFKRNGLTAVPRNGAPTSPQVAEVPPEFQKLCALEES